MVNAKLYFTLECAVKAQSRGKRYSSALSLSSALDRGGCQRHAPVALSPVMNKGLLYRRRRGPQGRSGRVRKISPLPGFDSRTVQSVASRYKN